MKVVAHVRGQAKRMLETLESLPIAVQISEAHSIDPEWVDALNEDDAGSRLKLVLMLRSLRDQTERPSLRIARFMRDAFDAQGTGVLEDEDPALGTQERPPSWPSGVAPLDAHTGGFSGLTVIAGETGVGKTMLALASAVHAAEAGWSVAYFNSELDRPTMALYLQRALNRPVEEMRRALERFTLFHLAPSATPSAIVASACEVVVGDRMLVVLDSLNSIVEMMMKQDGPETYFADMRSLLMWCLQARKTSDGQCAFIVTSELNAKGETKGRKADYWADTVVSLKRGDHPDYVEMRVTKARYSGPRDLGVLLHDHARARFLTVSSAEDSYR